MQNLTKIINGVETVWTMDEDSEDSDDSDDSVITVEFNGDKFVRCGDVYGNDVYYYFNGKLAYECENFEAPKATKFAKKADEKVKNLIGNFNYSAPFSMNMMILFEMVTCINDQWRLDDIDLNGIWVERVSGNIHWYFRKKTGCVPLRFEKLVFMADTEVSEEEIVEKCSENVIPLLDYLHGDLWAIIKEDETTETMLNILGAIK